jgi:Flp pilus assembly protein TadB
VAKQRQVARAERERAAARAAAQAAEERQRTAAARARSERRSLAWRRIRIWQHGPAFRRNRERWGALASIVLVLLLLVYLFTGSITALIACGLFCLVGLPVLVLLFFDRRRM